MLTIQLTARVSLSGIQHLITAETWCESAGADDAVDGSHITASLVKKSAFLLTLGEIRGRAFSHVSPSYWFLTAGSKHGHQEGKKQTQIWLKVKHEEKLREK